MKFKYSMCRTMDDQNGCEFTSRNFKTSSKFNGRELAQMFNVTDIDRRASLLLPWTLNEQPLSKQTYS